MSATIPLAEVARHATENDCWIVIDSVVYNVTKFLNSHPAGKGVILAFAGKDATESFFDFHRKDILRKYGEKLRIGVIEGGSPTIDVQKMNCEIDTITPFAETTYWRGWYSPYYNESHKQFRLSIRKLLAEALIPTGEADEEAGRDASQETMDVMGKSGALAGRVGVIAAPFMKEIGLTFCGTEPDKADYFHEMICHQEFARLGFPGVTDGIGAGLQIGLPPVIHFGTEEIHKKYVAPCLLGQKRICLAVSEPSAGSDVANLVTSARLSPDGKHYIVNGMKKWITAGFMSDYFVTAVRTGGPSHGGISFLLIERGPGVTTTKIKTSYSPSGGTSLILFDNVMVPRENLLGEENDGFRLIMANFNHERWSIVAGFVTCLRMATADCYKWAIQRKAFGKRLIDQPVIRYKLAEMSAAVESLESWLESITHQMNVMNYMEQTLKLSAPIALMKFHATRLGGHVVDNACQIFGGRAITRTGMGQYIERLQRGYKFAAIYGGSEEILADLAVRQSVHGVDRAMKKSKKAQAMARL